MFKALSLTTLLLSVVAPFSAMKQAAAVVYVPAIEESNPRDDLLENDRFRTMYGAGYYDTQSVSSDPVNNPEGIWPLQFTEWHYGYNDYALYFYVWNETAFDDFNLTSVLNGISIQDLDSGSYYFYQIEKISDYQNRFYKFKVLIDDLNANTFLTDEGVRQYNVGQLHLKKNANIYGLATAYNYGKQYIYTGSLNEEDLAMEENELETLSIDVKGGTYAVQASNEDVFRHSELHYVYYSIPDSMLEEYGEVAEYHFSYHPIQLAPIVAIQGSEVNSSTIVSTTNINDFATNYFAKYQWLNNRATEYTNVGGFEYGITGAYLAPNSLNNVGIIASRVGAVANALGSIALAFCTYGAGALLALGSPAVWAYSELLAIDGWNLLRDLYIDNDFNAIELANPEDDVTSDKLDEFINLNNLSNWAIYSQDSNLRRKYSTFNEYFNASKIEEHLRYDQEDYELKTFSKDKYSFAKDGIKLSEDDDSWNTFQNGSVTVAPIEEISSSDAATNETNWKLEKGTGSEFHNDYLAAKARNETPYIFRFAPTPSLVYPLYWSKVDNGSGLFGIGELNVANCNRIGTSYTGVGIYNLTSLDLTFAKEGQETIIPIAADPININPRIDHATASESDNWLDMIKKFLTIILIVLLVMFSLWILFKIIGWTRRAFAK